MASGTTLLSSGAVQYGADQLTTPSTPVIAEAFAASRPSRPTRLISPRCGVFAEGFEQAKRRRKDSLRVRLRRGAFGPGNLDGKHYRVGERPQKLPKWQVAFAGRQSS
jgi:hypothetical protein